MVKTITLKDIAKRCKVSVSTVSGILNNPHKFKPKTREKVLSTIKELKYEPDWTARALVQGRKIKPVKKRAIGILISEMLADGFSNPVASGIINGIVTGVNGMKKLLEKKLPITAVFAMNDDSTL